MRNLREARVAAGPDELAALETDVFSGFVLARAAAGLADATIVSDVVNLEQIRVWFGRPLWEMEPPHADAYFGKVLRSAAKGTRQARSRALRVYFLFLEIRHKVEIHQLTGRVVECPIDEREAIHARCPGSGVTRDPVERHEQRCRIAHEVEQVVEPAAGIGHRPAVKFGLHLGRRRRGTGRDAWVPG